MNDPLPPSPAPPPGDDKLWIMLCHLSLLIGVGFLLPLVVYFVKRHDSPLTAEHAKEALNFHISIYLYGFVFFLLSFALVGIPFLIADVLLALVLPIVACVKASNGQFYRYPLTVRLVS